MKSDNNRILPLSTVALLLLSVLIFRFATDNDTLSAWGSYVSGVASAIAFLWLIAGFVQQGSELRMQREELSLQRKALELQRDELHQMSKYAALEQISTVLENFRSSLPRDPLPQVTRPDHLSAEFMKGMTTLWKPITESKNPQQVFDANLQWMAIEGLCTEFMASVGLAINLYSDSTKEFPPVTDGNVARYIYFNNDRIRSIPHLQQYSGAICALAANLFLLEPGIKRVRLAGFEAVSALMPNVVKKDELEKLRKEVKEMDKQIESND